MGAPYTSQSAPATYNATPPSDDGSQTEANEITWSKHKTKLGDPLKTFAESINSQTLAAFGKILGGAGVTSTTAPYTVLASDQGKLVNITSTDTVTTPVAATVGSPFVFGLLNTSGASLTFDGNGSETIDGGANITVKDNEGVLVFTDGSNWFTLGRTQEAPSVPDAPSGLKLLGTVTDVASAQSSIDYATIFSANTSYTGFLIKIEGLELDADADLYLRFSDDGSTFEADASDYEWTTYGVDGAATVFADYSSADTECSLTGSTNFPSLGGAAGEHFNAEIWVNAPAETDIGTHYHGTVSYTGSADGALVSLTVSGKLLATGATTGFQILPSTGNIDDGHIGIWGLIRS